MATLLQCQYCKKDAAFMCTKRSCLGIFCNTCPTCQPGVCNDDEHRVFCWNHHLPPPWSHDRGTHEKCGLEDRKFISDVFYCEGDPKRQKVLHQEDRKTLWFIVKPGEDIAVDDLDPAAPLPRREGSVYITGRLGNILMQETPPVGNRFPRLVSFIGETGAGKSTLIRALIMEASENMQGGHADHPQIESPVAQTTSIESTAFPTSSGVHLYKDPGTFSTLYPTLFADCEGFNAGGISAASFPEDLATDKNILTTIPMTANSYTTSVDNEDFYAKSLYTFSDCVCFVIKNPQTVAKSMEKLLVWAAKGSGTTVHALRQKSLILVLNQQSQHTVDIMDEGTLRETFLGEHITFWKGNAMLEDIRKEAFKDSTVTPEKFLHLYFSTVNVFYIPDGSRTDVGHPRDIRLQIRKLYTQIGNCVKHIEDIRRNTWTLYNEKNFTRLFFLAVQHFAETDNVFNFFEATKSTSLDHRSLEDHILALRRQFVSATIQERQAQFPSIVGSALVNKVLREGTAIGTNSDKKLQWDKCHDPCKRAIGRFYKEYQPCDFTKNSKQCIQTYNLHGASHRDKDGRIMNSGDFQPNFEEITKCVTEEAKEIEAQFHMQCTEMLVNHGTSKGYPAPSSIVQHRRNVLHQMYKPACPLFNYRTCIACLHAAPDHVLPCGHAFCETCATDFGEPMVEQAGAYKIGTCIFCEEKWEGEEAQIIQTKPSFAGVRILTLDGGGVRGILELLMLRLLSEMIGLELNISHFFDLIVGTSTGGLIALGLGVEEMELPGMESRFTELARDTFAVERGGTILRTGILLAGIAFSLVEPPFALAFGLAFVCGWGANIVYWRSLYATGPLRDGMQRLLGTTTSMFGSPMRRKQQRSTRVAVICMKDAANVSAIANYNRPLTADGASKQQDFEAVTATPDGFERAENETEELKAWEAALATSAAPPYFKPFIKESSRRIYIDGGLEHNNPIFWATEEYRKIWEHPESKLDVIVSVGSGILANPDPEDKPDPPPIQSPPPIQPNPLMTIFDSTIHRLKGEKIWDDFRRRQPQYSPISHRLDIVIKDIKCSLDNCAAMDDLVLAFNKTIVYQGQYHLSNENQVPANRPLRDNINVVAHLLVAKLFFFEPLSLVTFVDDTPNSRGLFKIQGKILCRLRQGSSALKDVVRRIVAFSVAEGECEAELYQVPASGTGIQISTIGIGGVKQVVESGESFEITHTITTSNPDRYFQTILVELKHAAVVPSLKVDKEDLFSDKITLGSVSDKLAISGFPCKISALTRKTRVMSRR